MTTLLSTLSLILALATVMTPASGPRMSIRRTNCGPGNMVNVSFHVIAFGGSGSAMHRLTGPGVPITAGFKTYVLAKGLVSGRVVRFNYVPLTGTVNASTITMGGNARVLWHRVKCIKIPKLPFFQK